MAVLLVHVIAGLNRLVGADQPLLSITQGLDGLLRSSLHLEPTNLLWLKVAVLLLDWEGEDVGKLLAVPVHVSLADLHLDLSRDVVATLCGFPITHDTLGTIPIVLGTLIPLAVEFHGVGAGYIVDHLLLHVAVGSLHVGA